MFVVWQPGSRLAWEDVPAIPQRGQLSGADIEGMVGRAWRPAHRGQDYVTKEALAGVGGDVARPRKASSADCETAALLEARIASACRRRSWRR
jgi:hypothetical protein